MVTLQISKMYSVSPHQAHSLKRLIFNEGSITFVFWFKIHALMNNTVLSLCSKCISMWKKGKDIVHIFTTFPKGSNKISVKIYVPVYLKFSWMKPNLWMEDIFFNMQLKQEYIQLKRLFKS